MAVKKSELYSMLWEACNKLRGGVEPSRYKDYVLVLLFFKYVSDRYKCYGIAALSAYESLYDIKEVSLSIFQPRRENVQTWTVSVEELKAWAENELKPKAQMAAKGEGEYCPGEWCQFCRAAVKCRARATRCIFTN